MDSLEVIKIKMIKNLPRFIKYTKDKQNHQKWVWRLSAWTMSFKTNWTTPFQPLPFPLSAGDRNTGSHTETSSTSSPNIHSSSLSFSSGIKGHLLEAPPPPGPGSLTASSLHIQFAFQDFLHRAPTIRIPKEQGVSFWMSSFSEGAGGDPWGEGFMPDSPLYLRVSTLTLVCWREGGREGKKHPPPHTHPQLTNYTPLQPATTPQTLHSRWASLLLRSNSFQE